MLGKMENLQKDRKYNLEAWDAQETLLLRPHL